MHRLLLLLSAFVVWLVVVVARPRSSSLVLSFPRSLPARSSVDASMPIDSPRFPPTVHYYSCRLLSPTVDRVGTLLSHPPTPSVHLDIDIHARPAFTSGPIRRPRPGGPRRQLSYACTQADIRPTAPCEHTYHKTQPSHPTHPRPPRRHRRRRRRPPPARS